MTDRQLARRVVALSKQMRAGPRPTDHEDPVLDELAALLEQGLPRRAFVDELLRQADRAGLRVDRAALARFTFTTPLHSVH